MIGEIGDVVGEGIDGKVATQCVLFRSAEDIVPQDHPFLALQMAWWSTLPLGLLPAPFHRQALRDSGAKCGNLDDLIGKMEVGQPETPPDQAAIAEEPLDLPGSGIGNHVEVFRFTPQEEVADTAADQVGDKTVVLETIQYPEGIGAEHPARNGVA